MKAAQLEEVPELSESKPQTGELNKDERIVLINRKLESAHLTWQREACRVWEGATSAKCASIQPVLTQTV